MPPPSLGSPEALYHVVPSPEYDVNASQIELDRDGDRDATTLSPPPVDNTPFLIDSSIRWIHFVLGCSVLLSWNGTSDWQYDYCS